MHTVFYCNYRTLASSCSEDTALPHAGSACADRNANMDPREPCGMSRTDSASLKPGVVYPSSSIPYTLKTSNRVETDMMFARTLTYIKGCLGKVLRKWRINQ
jgi:hypothetical protein